MSWELNGTYFEGCNCDSLCPCNTSAMGAPADHERCQFVIAFHIDSGQVDGVDISDRSCVLIGDAPQMMAEGGWKVGMFVDDGASPECRWRPSPGSSAAVWAGRWPRSPRRSASSSVPSRLQSPTRRMASATRSKSAMRSTWRINEVVQPESSESVHVTGLTGLPWGPEVSVATSERHSLNAFGLQWDSAGKNGNSAPISWSA